MRRMTAVALPIFSLLLSAFAVADDTASLRTDFYLSDLTGYSPPVSWQHARHAGYTFRQHPANAFSVAPYRTDALQPIENVAFRDPNAIARVSKVRELSLLTLAELGKTRLFFGVNTDGLFGFHLRALPKPGDERCVEFARMPYLKEASADNHAY